MQFPSHTVKPRFSGLDLTYSPHIGTYQAHLVEAEAQTKASKSFLTPPAEDEVRLNDRHLGTSEAVRQLSRVLSAGEEISERELRNTLTGALSSLNFQTADPEKHFDLNRIDRTEESRMIPVRELFERAKAALFFTLHPQFGEYRGQNQKRDEQVGYKTLSFASSPTTVLPVLEDLQTNR